MSNRVRGIRRFAIAAIALLLFGCMGWMVSDHLESNNEFCTSCHIAPGRPLHAAIRDDFAVRPPPTLAAAHGSARASDGNDQRGFRCIDCHGGVGLVGRARVKALAAKDAFFYVVGNFEEPSGMRWPLLDEDCAQCHSEFDERAPEVWQSPRFHQLPLHNTALGIDCVECHRSHDAGNPDAYHLQASEVRRQCARCHPEYEEETG
jgi:nitrate/TMAO reductase-like tetraheme cytochrome c subunit